MESLAPTEELPMKQPSYLKDLELPKEALSAEGEMAKLLEDMGNGDEPALEQRLSKGEDKSPDEQHFEALAPLKTLRGYLDKRSPVFFAGWQVSN